MIDLKKAKLVFNEYVNNYDQNDDKVILKISHTYRVMERCQEIAASLNLDDENIQLAGLIGLLHDIGRFEIDQLIHVKHPLSFACYPEDRKENSRGSHPGCLLSNYQISLRCRSLSRKVLILGIIPFPLYEAIRVLCVGFGRIHNTSIFLFIILMLLHVMIVFPDDPVHLLF